MQCVCKLCQRNAELQNSHIIPEFFYKLVYDPKPRRLHVISTKLSEKTRYQQKGLREFLLCSDCEQKIGRWENYAKKKFVDGHNLQINQAQDHIALRGIEYKRFKLFQLSLLWRMSVSKQTFFKEAAIEVQHEEKIRQALLNEDPLRPEDYCCVLQLLTLGGKFYPDLISNPWPADDGKHRVCMIVITGILFYFFVGDFPPPSSAVAMAITTNLL